MSRLRLATEDDLNKAEMKPILNLEYLGEIYLTLSPCENGVNLMFIKIISLGESAIPMFPPSVPKLIYNQHVHVKWWDSLLGLGLERKVHKAINKGKRRLRVYDSIIGHTGAKFITFLMGGDN